MPDGLWRTAEFSLNHDLTRNFYVYCYGYPAEVETIYYTRWVQNGLQLSILRDSSGEILIDQVELINKREVRVPGEGKSLRSWWQFPDFSKVRQEPVKGAIGSLYDGMRLVEEK